MSWNYRAMKDGDGLYSVHEVFDEKSYTNEIAPQGETIEDLIEVLEMMLNDLKTHGEYYK